MKELLVLPLTLLCWADAHACAAIAGRYVTVSESEWNYSLQLADDKAVLRHSAYANPGRSADAPLQSEVSETGSCSAVGGHYLLSFGPRQYQVRFRSALSHGAFGGPGASPGLLVEGLAPGQVLEFWLKDDLDQL